MMRYVSILLVLALLEAMGASCTGAQESPPRKYLLKDASIEIEIHSDLGGTTRMNVDGTGKTQLIYKMGTASEKKYEVTIHPNRVMNMLQELYEMRFFSYADEYSNGYPSIWLDGDTVRAASGAVCDQGSISVVCRIGSYSKGVKSSTKAPGDLWRYVSKIDRQMADSIKGR